MVSVVTSKEGKETPYLTFDRKSWKELRNSTPLTLDTEDLEEIKGINENISLNEVSDIYLPMSRLLHLYYKASRALYRARRQFLGIEHEKITFIIGIAGSVAVGKSTTARLLKTLISSWPGSPKVDLIPTDGFIYPNNVLIERKILNRKGFPESYNIRNLISFLYDLKSGIGNLKVPVYSHLTYDIVPDKFITVDRPDILLLEGLNVLQTPQSREKREPQFFVSDFFDFSIYIDADPSYIKKWFIERFKILMRTAFSKKESYFNSYSRLSMDEAESVAGKIWDEINAVNLSENIAPTKYHAHLILEKNIDHTIDHVLMRRI